MDHFLFHNHQDTFWGPKASLTKKYSTPQHYLEKVVQREVTTLGMVWYLKKICNNDISLDIIFIGHAGPLQEMDWVGVAKIPLKGLEHVLFHPEDIISVWHIDAMKKVDDGGWLNLFDFGDNEETFHTDQLKLR